MGTISHKIALHLRSENIIGIDELEIYCHGLELMFTKMLHFISMLLVGIAFGLFFETLIFVLAYSWLRIYAGGYHAENSQKCYILSWVQILTVTFLNKIIYLQTFAGLIIPTFLVMVFIWAKAPVDNGNNRLDFFEKKVYRLRARLILTIEVVALIIFAALGFSNIALSIQLSFFNVALMMGIELCRNATPQSELEL